MKLNVSKEKAINILLHRKAELAYPSFNAKAWKSKTENDLREIFPTESNYWFQISSIQFDSHFGSEMDRVMREGKETAYKLLESYIELIKNSSDKEEQQTSVTQNNYQEKYNALLIKWNAHVPERDKLLEANQKMQAENEDKKEQILGLNKQLAQIKDNTIHLDNISLNNLFKAFKNLPFKQLITIAATLIALLVGFFKLGSLYQENSMNTINYELKKQNDKNQDIILQKDNEITILKEQVESSKFRKDATNEK